MTTPAARRAATAVPQTLDEASAVLAEIGRLDRDKRVLQAALDEQVAGLKAQFEAQAVPIQVAIDAATQRLQAYAEANRASLTRDGRTKTVALPAGRIQWKDGRARLVVADADEVMAQLLESGETQFIRITQELDRAKLLASPSMVSKLTGVRIEPGVEEFIAKPVELPLAGCGA